MKEEKNNRKLGSKIKLPKNLISGHAEILNVNLFSMSKRCLVCGGASEPPLSCVGGCVYFATAHISQANKYKWQGKGCCSFMQLFS